MRKKITQILCCTVCIALVLLTGYFITALYGNPLSAALAKSSANRYLEENFSGADFEIAKVGYNLKTGGYYAHVESPSSPDSYFTVYLDGWGRYRYDTFESITGGTTTFARLDKEYRELVNSSHLSDIFDISMDYFELRAAGYFEIFSYTNEAGETKEYTLWKDYGLDMTQLILDGEYDIRELGRNHGTLCLYVHDPEVSVERAAALLLELKKYMDAQNVPFHAVEFHLHHARQIDSTTPNYETIYSGESIVLYEFLYSDIYEEGLIDRVQQHWNAAQEHYAIQDEEIINSELKYLEEFVIPEK